MPSVTTTVTPVAEGTDNAMVAGGGYTKLAAIQNPLAIDSFYVVPLVAFDFQTWHMSDIPVPGGSLVSKIVMYCQLTSVTSGPGPVISRLRIPGQVITAGSIGYGTGTVVHSHEFLASDYGGFTVNDANNMELGIGYNWASDTPHWHYLYAEVTFDPIPGELEHSRVLATYKLLERREPRRLIRTRGPLRVADTELMSLLPWSHRRGLAADGLGWGDESWRRRLSRPIMIKINPNTMEVAITAQDVHHLLLLYYDEGRSFITGSSIADGVGRIYVGTRTYERDSYGYVEDPADGIVKRMAYDIEMMSGDALLHGQMIENRAYNICKRSSFVSGTTGLTLAGTGTNGSSIAVDTTDLLFDSSITPNSLKWTAGNPHTAVLRATWVASDSTPADHVLRVSIDHKDDSGAPLYWNLQRSSDSKYWNDTASTWDVAAPDNALAVSTTKTRAISKNIPTGTSAKTFVISILQKSGGTASRVNRVYHVQVERQVVDPPQNVARWVSSRIVTNGSQEMRAGGILKVTNNVGARNWPLAHGTALCEVIPSWDYTDVAVLGFMYVMGLSYSGTETIRWFYDGVNQLLTFRIRHAGVTYLATKSWQPMRGVMARIAVRWTGAEGELGLTPFTASVFVDGEKGTDVVFVQPTESDTVDLEFGSLADLSNSWDGVIRRIRITQRVLSDEEIENI